MYVRIITRFQIATIIMVLILFYTYIHIYAQLRMYKCALVNAHMHI